MSTPLSLTKIVRERFLAREKSDEVFSTNVRRRVESIDTSIYGEVGSAPGSMILGHTPDTTGLDMEEWGFNSTYKYDGNQFSLGPASALRGDTRHKLNEQTLNLIDSSYRKLNSNFVRCLPNEFPEDFSQSLIRDPGTGMSISAHDFRFTGDVAGTMIIGRMKNIYRGIVENVFGSTLTKFITYLAAPKSTTRVKPIVKNVQVEGVEIPVDVKGDKIVVTDNTLESRVL